MTNMTAEWQSYIAREIDTASRSWIEAAMAAVGQVLAEERAEREQLAKYLFEMVREAELKSLQAEALANRLSLELADLCAASCAAAAMRRVAPGSGRPGSMIG